MKLGQYREAVKGEWLDHERIKQLNLNPQELHRLDTTKITYIVGKASHLVPVIFPSDVLPALEYYQKPKVD